LYELSLESCHVGNAGAVALAELLRVLFETLVVTLIS
jgi:hypothetical protein